MKYIFQVLVLLGFIFCSSCADRRTDAFDEKRFDVENAFIRFNYGYVLNEGAQDSLLLELTDLGDTTPITIPLAMSSDLQPDTVQVLVRHRIMGSMGDMEVLGSQGVPLDDEFEVHIQPNELEVQIEIQIREPEPAEILFELIDNTAGFHMGFPESGAHSTFKIIIK